MWWEREISKLTFPIYDRFEIWVSPAAQFLGIHSKCPPPPLWRHSIWINGGQSKSSWMVVLYWNCTTCGNAYAITFKVRLLHRARTHKQSIQPWKNRRKGFFWDLAEFGRRNRVEVLHGCETCPLEAHSQSRELPGVSRGEVRRVWWLSDDRNVFLGEELLLNERGVARYVIVKQKPLPLPATCRAASSAKLSRRNFQ
jgi:hypothetical protein